MRFPRCRAHGADRDSDQTVCSGIAATLRLPFGVAFELATSCPCWPCAAPSMGVAWVAGAGSWSAPSPGSVSFAAYGCDMTSGPNSRGVPVARVRADLLAIAAQDMENR